GTDTDAGKTLVALSLLHAAHAKGLSTLGLKPVAAGGSLHAGEFQNEDARLLQNTASVSLEYADVNPVALKAAIAPHIAARQEGVSLSVSALADHCRDLLQHRHADLAVVEGAGGWLVPLAGQDTMADLAVAIGLPVILVIRLQLGCLNHALLTAGAITAAGLPLAGWIGSAARDAMAAADENLATLHERLPGPCLGVLPYLGADPDPADAAVHLDLSSLGLKTGDL
ncbi:MAG: dethiobiotin synthase, partial [Gammaproteobacteria bacterium]